MYFCKLNSCSSLLFVLKADKYILGSAIALSFSFNHSAAFLTATKFPINQNSNWVKLDI